jgi:O-antigen/teichoic acid export membrane protein
MLLSAPSKSALLAMNRPGFILFVTALSTVAFLIIAAIAIPRFGGLGASYAHLGLAALTAAMFQTALLNGKGRADLEPKGKGD